MTDTIIVDRTRNLKASRLAVVLAQAGATSKTVPYIDDTGWLLAAAAARVREPSERTRAAVRAWLAERERPAVDPFAGLDLDTAYAV